MTTDGLDIRLLASRDAALLRRVAPGVFDGAADDGLTAEFLADPRHHLIVALADGLVVGIASGIHYIHPDKPAELFINEVGVADDYRGRGIGRQVLQALLAHGRALGCRQAWVLTSPANAPALRIYRRAGGEEEPASSVMFTFPLAPGEGAAGP